MVLDNILEGSRNLSEAQEDGAFLVVERTLEENSRYSFYIMVTNEVGVVESTPIQIGE